MEDFRKRIRAQMFADAHTVPKTTINPVKSASMDGMNSYYATLSGFSDGGEERKSRNRGERSTVEMRSSEPRLQTHADQRFLRAPKARAPGGDVARVNPNASLTEQKTTSKATGSSVAPSTRSLDSGLRALTLQNTSGLSGCLFCCGDHTLDLCEKFLQRSSRSNVEFLMEKGLCFGCLRKGHLNLKCENRLSCSKCGETHPTALHRIGLDELLEEFRFQRFN